MGHAWGGGGLVYPVHVVGGLELAWGCVEGFLEGTQVCRVGAREWGTGAWAQVLTWSSCRAWVSALCPRSGLALRWPNLPALRQRVLEGRSADPLFCCPEVGEDLASSGHTGLAACWPRVGVAWDESLRGGGGIHFREGLLGHLLNALGPAASRACRHGVFTRQP